MPDFANMTEEEQIAFAMQMSMQDQRKFPSLKNTNARIFNYLPDGKYFYVYS